MSLDSNVIELLQKQFPRGTKIVLPNGIEFDTRIINSNSDFHARNNRIMCNTETSNAKAIVHHGMIDKLHPDYSNLSPSFENSALDQTSLANILPTIHKTYFGTPVPKSLNSLDHQLASELVTAAVASNQVLVDDNNHECAFSVSSTVSSIASGRVVVAPSKVVNLKQKLILVYPFEYDETALSQTANGLIELGGDLLGLDDTK